MIEINARKYTEEERKRMINQTGLLERGWTKSMIEKLLPEPMLFDNLKYRTAAPVKRWWIEDVEQAEQTEAFKILQEKAQKRSTIGKAAAEVRKQATIEMNEKMLQDIKVDILSDEELEKRTLDDKEMRAWQRGNWDFDRNTIPHDVLVRWKVNYIRHNLTYYDGACGALFGRVGRNEAYRILKKGVLGKIAEAYPYLKEECERQIEAYEHQPEMNEQVLKGA